MRHNYHTRGIVLARTPLGEANALITLLTHDLGLVRARAQGLRKSSAKLAPALSTFAESDIVLVKGREGWRATGAISAELWHRRLTRPARLRAGRVAGLLLRLVPGEATDAILFSIFSGFLVSLTTEDEGMHDAAECLAALRILGALGFDAGVVPGRTPAHYEPEVLQDVARGRSSFVARINHGIEASGL